jgi:hypothetical protein
MAAELPEDEENHEAKRDLGAMNVRMPSTVASSD